MANNRNRISSSEYDIYNKLIDMGISGGYFGNPDTYNIDDIATTSTIGYETEAFAMIMRDSSFHKTMVYREGTLNTAILPKTIYNFAKMFNVDVLDAMPSLRYATITIATNVIDDIINSTNSKSDEYRKKYGILENGNFMVLDKINTIIAGEYTFSLEHSIEIYRNARQKYVVKYCLNEQVNTTSFGTYPAGGIINTSTIINDGVSYISFNVVVAQYKPVIQEKIISGSAFTDTKIHEFDYDGQICGLSLKYSKGTSEELVDLKFSNIKLESDMESENMTAYYDLLTENILEINFVSTKTVPQTGGILELTTFITEGLGGNISYNGEAVFAIKQDDFKSRPILVNISKDILSSGRNQTSLGELKNLIINKISLRDTIVTESDLNTWFTTQSAMLENINNSKITFRKEKDNLLKRSFSAYLLLRDGVKLENYLKNRSQLTPADSNYISSVVPTNTIDLLYTTNDNSNTNKTITIKPSDMFAYDPSTKQFNNTSIISSDYNYRCPFEISLNTKYNSASYFYMETDDTSELEFDAIDTLSNITLIPISVNVYSQNITNSTDDNTFTFSFTVASDVPLNDKIIRNLKITNSASTVSVGSGDSLRFKLDMERNEERDDGLSYYVLEVTGISDKTITSISDKTSSINISFDGNTLPVYNETKIGISFNFADQEFSGTMMSTDKLTIFYKLDDVLMSDVIERAGTGTTKQYIIKEVPVIANYWYDQTSENRRWLIRQLFTYIDMLKANIGRLETSTFFNIKFRNTYGISQYLSTSTPQIRLALTIYLNRDAAASVASTSLLSNEDNYESLQNEIRDFIRVRVDAANNEGKLQVSKIIMDTQAMYYNYINHIDFNSLNGTFNQSVSTIERTDNTFPLEYFSLDETLDDSGDSKVSRISEDITFVLE